MSRGRKVEIFRSGLEQKVAEQMDSLGVKYEYENNETKIKYSIPAHQASYLPDFLLQLPSGRRIYVEAKGIWDYKDRYKHLLIRRQHPEHDIRFVFQRAGQRIRKGSATTYRDICEGRGRGLFKGITWKYGDKGLIPEEWLEDNDL